MTKPNCGVNLLISSKKNDHKIVVVAHQDRWGGGTSGTRWNHPIHVPSSVPPTRPNMYILCSNLQDSERVNKKTKLQVNCSFF